MYCKLFSSLYQGTLRGKSHEILVFTNLLAHCDAHGYVDKHWKAISDEVGLTIEEVKEAIAFLEAPDPESRSHDHDGARIIKMDGHRAWGWQVVNYEKYRSIRDEEDRREQNRLAQQRFRDKHKPQSATVSHGKPQSSEGEGEGEGEGEDKKEITISSSLNGADLALHGHLPRQKTVPAARHALLKLWNAEYPTAHGDDVYHYVAAKDDKPMDDLLSRFSPDQVMERARKGWKSKNDFIFKSSSTFNGLNRFWDDIGNDSRTTSFQPIKLRQKIV